MDHRKAGTDIGLEEKVCVVFTAEVLQPAVRFVFGRTCDLIARDDRHASLEQSRIGGDRRGACRDIDKYGISKISRKYLVRKSVRIYGIGIVEIEIDLFDGIICKQSFLTIRDA